MNKSSLSRKRNTHSIQPPIVRLITLCFIAAMIASCGSSKPHVITTKAEAKEYQEQIASARPVRKSITRNTPERPDTEPIEEEPVVEEVPLDMTTADIAIKTAMNYEGVRYRYGGSTRAGMDCSGLLHISFAEAGQKVPRTSMSFFQTATPIDVKEVRRGDLMFFATGRDRKKINHVALVTEVTPAEVRFVHATVSQGVVISSLNEPYWLGKYRSSGRLF